MRYRQCALTLVLMLFVILSCACGDVNRTKKPVSDGSSLTASPASSTTVMIYMVGSDLESKGGAATKDLQEITDSGVDITNNHVVVYAGGSPYWHNDLTSNDVNSILQLQASGFEQISAEPTKSMGEAETLTQFLNFCVENYPSDQYCLIFWNHGNGPVMGFGKDMQHGNDALTLSEMHRALKESPFGPEKKLSWVGFDACLMSSAELSCVWNDYAHYLIASQEIEPAFGWNYAFMSMLGKSDCVSFLQNLTQKYYEACMDYFKLKGYDDRETTLACIDLSYAQTLSDAIDALFSATLQDVDHRYQELITSRINTRALGRASTGSEYDLVDLKSMAEQLLPIYPEQAAAVIDAIEQCVVINATNADELNGVSLYYPFYNKDYYSNVWAEEYRNLNLFENYQCYLANYEKTWLGSDMLADFASSQVPVQISEGSYSLKLTEEQKQHFASAKYYVLRELASETYTKVFTSNDVTYKDGTLFANFDGDVIYAKNQYNEPLIPVTVEHDIVGENTNFSTFVHVTNEPQDIAAIDEYEYNSMYCRVWFAANKSTKEIKINALLPATTDGTAIAEGKLEEVDLSEFTVYNFWDSTFRTIKRTDSGVIVAYDDWHVRSSIAGMQWRIQDGLEFVYAPLTAGDYAIVFEIQDTQGNRYCSEPISIETADDVIEPENDAEPATTVEWDGKDEVLLKQTEEYALYLTEAEDTWNHSFTLVLENYSDRPVTMTVREAVYNDNIYCDDAYFGMVTVEPDDSEYYHYGVNFGTAINSGAIRTIENLLIKVGLCDAETRKTIWNDIPIEIDFSKSGGYRVAQDELASTPIIDSELQPIGQAVVSKQTILDENGLTVDLLCFGQNDDGDSVGLLHVDNQTGEQLYFAIDGFVLNDVFISDYLSVALANGQQGYYEFGFDAEELTKAGIEDVSNMKIAYRFANDSMILWLGYGQTDWKELELSQRAPTPSTFEVGEEILWKEHDITVALKAFETGSSFTWTMTVDNQSDEAISFDITSKMIDGIDYDDTKYNFYIPTRHSAIGPRQKRVLEVILYNNEGRSDFSVNEISFRFVVMDFTKSKILFLAESETVLKVK